MRKLLALLVAPLLVLAVASPARAGEPYWVYRTADPRDATWHCNIAVANYANVYSCAVTVNDYAQSAIIVHWTPGHTPPTSSYVSMQYDSLSFLDGGVYFSGWGCGGAWDSANPWMICFTATVHIAGSHTWRTYYGGNLQWTSGGGNVDGPGPLNSPTASF